MRRTKGFLVVGISGLLLLGSTGAPQDPQGGNRSQNQSQNRDQNQGQDPNTEDPPPIPTNLFLVGWMAELLHADRKTAREHYRTAMNDPDLPDHQSTLSILRLWESNWFRSDRIRYRDMLEKRGLIYQHWATWNNERFETLSTGFAEALAQDDEEKLVELRQIVAGYAVDNPAFRSRRTLVHDALPDLREPTGSDPYLELLKQRLAAAREKGDRRSEWRLRREIQLRSSVQRQQSRRQRINTLRLIGKRWADMTRLHLEGQHRRAARMESLNGGRDRFNGRGRFRTWESCRADIQRWDEATHRTRLASVLERLTTKAPMTWRTLLDPERNVLTELHRRMTELAASGRVEQALQLAARTPYRYVLFGRTSRPR